MPTPVHRAVSNYPRAVGAFIAVVVFATAIFAVAYQGRKNKEAIEKGCILLNNAIIKSSQAQSDPNSPSSALIEGIFAAIPPKYIRLYKTRLKKYPLVLPLINCKAVSNDPGSIKAIPLKPKVTRKK